MLRFYVLIILSFEIRNDSIIKKYGVQTPFSI